MPAIAPRAACLQGLESTSVTKCSSKRYW